MCLLGVGRFPHASTRTFLGFCVWGGAGPSWPCSRLRVIRLGSLAHCAEISSTRRSLPLLFVDGSLCCSQPLPLSFRLAFSGTGARTTHGRPIFDWSPALLALWGNLPSSVHLPTWLMGGPKRPAHIYVSKNTPDNTLTLPHLEIRRCDLALLLCSLSRHTPQTKVCRVARSPV